MKPNMIVVHEKPKNDRVLENTHPCLYGRHRPAYLSAGGMACGVCGVRL